MIKLLYNGEGGSLLCDYNCSPYNGKHNGIDYGLRKGATVYSLIDGEILRVNVPGDGSLSTIAIYDTTNNKTVIYLHIAGAKIEQGKVIKGQAIAVEAAQGTGTPHTHVEVHNGKPVDVSTAPHTTRIKDPAGMITKAPKTDAPEQRQVEGQQKGGAAAREGVNPQDKARIEAGIRKKLSLPASAVFSEWHVLAGLGAVTIETPSKRGSQWIVRERWPFRMEQNDMITLGGSPISKDEVDTADMAKSFLDICKSGNYERIKAALASRGHADTHATDKNGNNALHIAAMMNHGPKIVELLVQAGISSYTANKNGESPLTIYEKKKGNPASIRILQEQSDSRYVENSEN